MECGLFLVILLISSVSFNLHRKERELGSPAKKFGVTGNSSKTFYHGESSVKLTPPNKAKK